MTKKIISIGASTLILTLIILSFSRSVQLLFLPADITLPICSPFVLSINSPQKLVKTTSKPSFASILDNLSTTLDVIEDRRALGELQKILALQTALIPSQWLAKTVSIVYEPKEAPGQKYACVLVQPRNLWKARKICRLLAFDPESQSALQKRVPEDPVAYHDSFQSEHDHFFHQEKNGLILLSMNERATLESIAKNSENERSSLFPLARENRKETYDVTMAIDGKYLRLPSSSSECLDFFPLHNIIWKFFQKIEKIDYKAHIEDRRIMDRVTIQLKGESDLLKNGSTAFKIESEEHLLHFIPEHFSIAAFISIHDKVRVFDTIKRFASLPISEKSASEELVRALFESAHERIGNVLNATGDFCGIILGASENDHCSFLFLISLRNKKQFVEEIEPFLRIASSFGYVEHHTDSAIDILSLLLPFSERAIPFSVAVSGDTFFISSSSSFLRKIIDAEKEPFHIVHDMQATAEPYSILSISNIRNFTESWKLNQEILAGRPVSVNSISFDNGAIVCRGDGQFGSLPAFLSLYSFFFPLELHENETKEK